MNSDEEDDIVNPKNLPIYRKGKEIFDMVYKITALISENDEYLNEIKVCMLSDAALLTVKVAGAEAAELYDIKMENAAIIRKAARDLMVQQHSLDAFGFEFNPSICAEVSQYKWLTPHEFSNQIPSEYPLH